MRWWRKHPIWVGLGIVGFLALGIVVILVAALVAPSESELARAEGLWAARTFTDYTLDVSVSNPLVRAVCGQTSLLLTVHGEDVVATDPRIENEFCEFPLYTVDGLFEQIEVFEPTCGPNGCRCDGRTRMEVAYDPQLGYPTHILVSVDRPAPPLITLPPIVWQVFPLLSPQACTAIGYDGREITVNAVTPLP